jgi:hypothetical protein
MKLVAIRFGRRRLQSESLPKKRRTFSTHSAQNVCAIQTGDAATTSAAGDQNLPDVAGG